MGVCVCGLKCVVFVYVIKDRFDTWYASVFDVCMFTRARVYVYARACVCVCACVHVMPIHACRTCRHTHVFNILEQTGTEREREMVQTDK